MSISTWIIRGRIFVKILTALSILCVLLRFSHADEPQFEHLSVAEGLSQSTVLCILQDSKGLMWVGTENGLNQYDGYQFTVYKHHPNNPNSLSSNYIWSIQEEREGILWVGTNNGLNRFDTIHQTVKQYFHHDNDPSSLSHNDIRAVYKDRQGTIWVGTVFGLNRFDPKTETFIRYQSQEHDPTSLSSNQINWTRSIYEDRQGNFWIGTFGGGLNKLDRRTGVFTHFRHQPDNPHSLGNEEINAIYQDQSGTLWIAGSKGLDRFDSTTHMATHYLQELVFLDVYSDTKGFLWLGTDGSGVYHLNPETGHFEHYGYDSRKPTGLNNGFINVFYEDRAGALWVGTWGGGVNKFDPITKPFGFHPYQPYNPEGLSAPAIFDIHEDAEGQTLWMSTEGGGLNQFNRKTGTFIHYRHDDNNLNSLSDDSVYSMFQDKQGKLWIGTWGGLNYFDPVKKEFTRYLADENHPNSLSGNEVYSLLQDRQGHLWIGTWYSGLNRFNPKTQSFTRYQFEESNPQSLGDNLAFTLYEDRQGTIWVGTGNGGLNRFNPETETFTRYQYHDQDVNSLSNNYVTALYEDSQGRFWVGTRGGLNQMNRAKGQFHTYGLADGLPDEVIYKIVEDSQGFLWLATSNGLSRFDPHKQQFRNYTVEDGLQGKEFYTGTMLSTGELAFGGRNGFNLFRPEAIRDNPFIPPIVLTDFKIFNQSVVPGQHAALSQSMLFTDTITLSHQDTVFSFEFSSLNYLSPHQNRYAYKMDGFDQNWVEVDSNRRFITYTNLAPGHYTFRVKGSNNDDIWNEIGTAVKLTILPPWWQTWWAYLIYFTVTVGSLVALFTIQQRKLAQTRIINERLRQVDKLKDEFLANTSHELRTPLNGIIGLTESLLQGVAGPLSEKMEDNLEMIVSSAKRLATLVNDILDFSKLKHKTIALQLKAIELREIVEVVFFLSRPSAAMKSLHLVNAVTHDLPAVWADENRLQQILYNLVGNAIKFTERGQIEITALVDQSISMIQVTVSDTGIGIPEDKQERIFESFEQVDGSTDREYGGTGLGLAVTKQLVKLHNGDIKVASQIGLGSQFTFTLPLASDEARSQTPPSQIIQLIRPFVTETVLKQTPFAKDQSPSTEGRCQVLVVDDEPINLQVLNNFLSLQESYHIVQATSGIEAMKLIEEGFLPDIILLDVMMPKMSGYEVTRKLREKWALNELPILLLTAKDRVEDLITGLDSGANDYLTKPFSKDELLARIKTHLSVKHLQEENMQMQAELNISRHLQQVLLPKEHELAQLRGLDIAGFMEPATKVGGDYYDVLVHAGGVKIGIGDVTGHGLESGILAMMVQTAVRTLLTHGESHAVKFLTTINRTIYDNVQRMGIDHNLTLCLLDWRDNQLHISGQHEEVLLLRNGQIERVNTMELGFIIGLEPDIADFVDEKLITLQLGDVVILYTDGMTEAENMSGELYGLERLCVVVSQHGQGSVTEIKQAIVEDVHQFMGQKQLLDDITLVVLKRVGDKG